MQDRLALMLDSMIFAVDNGHSFDGIVSVPQMGLEDFGHRPGLAGWLDEGAERLRSIISRFSPSRRPSPPPMQSPKADEHSHRDSGIGTGEKPFRHDPVTPPDSPTWEILPGGEESPRLPRKRLDQGPRGNVEGETREDRTAQDQLPRKKTKQADERPPRKKVAPSSPEPLPQKEDREVPTDGQKSSEHSTQGVGNFAPPSVAHSSSTGRGTDADVSCPSSVEASRHPRLNDKKPRDH